MPARDSITGADQGRHEPGDRDAPNGYELLALYALAWGAAAGVGSRGLVYWDAGDYVRLAIRGGESGLLLGRPLFLAVSQLVAHASLRGGAAAVDVEPVLRWFWTAVSATAPPLLATLVARLGLGWAPALAAGVALAVAPSFAHTAHQVLTDAPALALSIAGLVVALPRGPRPATRSTLTTRAAAAGAVLAFAIATRETAAVYAVSLVGMIVVRDPNRPTRRWTDAVVAVVALGGTLVVTLVCARAAHGASSVGMLAGDRLRFWATAMRGSASAHPVSPGDVAMMVAWLLALGPYPVIRGILGAFGLLRRESVGGASVEPARPSRALLGALTLPPLVATLALFAYPDGAFSPRYFLGVAPVALFVLGSDGLARDLWTPGHRVVAALLLVLPLALTPLATRRADALARQGTSMHARARYLPDDAVVVPGHFCPALGAALAAAEAVRARDGRMPAESPRIDLVCPGWEWPRGERGLSERLDAVRCGGRPAVVDLSDEAWVGAREVGPRDALRRYVGDGSMATIAGWTLLPPLRPSDAPCTSLIR